MKKNKMRKIQEIHDNPFIFFFFFFFFFFFGGGGGLV